MSTTLRFPITAQDHVQGADDAPITLLEYGDYQCPHCARAHPVVKGLQRRFGEQLRVVFRNFPLTEIHGHALHAAIAAESVGAQLGNDGYWKMHDAIYEHQMDSATALSDEQLARYAASVGGDPARVASDLESDAYADRIQADFGGGVRSGVNGTPTFFVNGERYDGDWTNMEGFSVALREAASQTSARREPRTG